ncbi:MAG TPA: amidohydrolase family protein [Opitutaceae bacterium]|nr:amidohydrolase family protein [Opitutaceae bacterium]
MIFDSHVYCFSAPDTRAGHASEQAHRDAWQLQYALHHQPAFRTSDRQPTDSRLLLDPTPTDPFRLNRNRAFRVDPSTKRLMWTVDGVDCTKQQLPPNVIEFSPGAIIAEMDYAGVDVALIHADATLTKDLVFLRGCVDAYPNRLCSMAPLEEERISTHPDEVIQHAVDAIQRYRQCALKVIPAYAYQKSSCRSFNDLSWKPFWVALSQLKVPVFFTLGARPGATDPRQGFVNELWELRKLVDQYPDLQTSVTHGYPWRDYLITGQFSLTESMWEPLRGTSIYLEVGFPFRIGDLFEYPYRECRPVLETMVEKIGADRLLWGSDMPFQNRFCTYRQSRDYLEKHCTSFLSPSDLAGLMGDNAARLLSFKSSA